jgi:hypothetical protein
MKRWFALALAGCSASTSPDPGPPLCATFDACGCAEPPCDGPALTDPVVVAPSPSLPPEVVSQTSHNNLDIAFHEGRLFFAFRTAPNHFASEKTALYVVSTADQKTWRHEATFALGTDLREPRFLAFGGRLWLYFAVLGTDPLDFEPQGTRVAEYLGEGRFSEPRESPFGADFIPWRFQVVGDTAWLVGYAGGAGVYDPAHDPLRVHLLHSADGEAWAGDVVLTGGVSETAFAFAADGGLVAVGRNEAGDEKGIGSRICRASADALSAWTCAEDPRKYDSPLLFRRGDDFWLIARRNVTADGAYDLGLDDLPPNQRQFRYQAEYWRRPKRCALWKVDPEALTVTFALDLPSAGDTCFPSALPLGDGQYLVYNYSSPFEKPDLSWLQGQNGPTFIYRTTLTLP